MVHVFQAIGLLCIQARPGSKKANICLMQSISQYLGAFFQVSLLLESCNGKSQAG
jgi:hypothetical protein